MAYIGKSPSNGIRNRFIYTATAGQATFSGTDDHNRTLSYTDAEFTDVFLNGVKLDKSDYTATSGTSIVLDEAAAAGDTLEVLNFDTFSVFSGEFSQDVTVGGATTLSGDLTVDTDTLYVDSTNNRVGIGTASPSKTVEVTSDSLSALKINGYSSSSGLPLYTYNDTSGVGICTGDADSQGQGYANMMYLRDTDNSFNVYLGNAGAVTHRLKLESDGDLHVDGNVVAYSTTVSDIRLKKDIAPIEDAVTKVQQLNGCTFTYLKDDRKSAGLIAQDVEKVLPSAVIEDEAVFHGEEGETYKTVQYDQVIGLLVEAVKELKSEIEELKDASSK